jgi:hypothetical protein
MWIDWTKPLVDRTLIRLSHNTVFEKSSLAIIAIKTEADPLFQKPVASRHHLGGSVQERAFS